MAGILLCYYTKTRRVMFSQRSVAVWNLKPQLWTLHTLTLRPTGPPCALNESFPDTQFCNLTRGSFRKYWFTKECRSSKCRHISWPDTLESDAGWYHRQSHQKSREGLGRRPSRDGRDFFQKSYFHSKAQILLLTTNTKKQQLSSFEETFSLCSFLGEKKGCQIPQRELP